MHGALFGIVSKAGQAIGEKDAKRGLSLEHTVHGSGNGCLGDNVFVERLWKSVKYEEVYLRAYDNVADARANLAKYLTFYNTKRLHQALDRNTPDNAYLNPPQPIPVAA
jgi:putative transposase